MHILQNLPLLTTCIDITLAHAPIIDHPHHFSGLLTLSLFLPRPLSLFLTHNQSSVQSVQSLRHGQLCDTTGCSMPGFPVHHQLPGLAQNHVHRVGDAISHLILCHPLLLLSLIFPIIRVFSNESVVCIRWPEYWSFNFSISPSNEYSKLISFRMDWFDLFGVQGTLKSLLQHHSSKASILRHSTFFTVQLPHLYMTTGKTIALTRWTFVGKIMSLLFNTLSRFERSPGEGNGNLLQYPCLKNPMDG